MKGMLSPKAHDYVETPVIKLSPHGSIVLEYSKIALVATLSTCIGKSGH